MPEYPEYPSRNDEEQAPAPERIIERIINGQLRPAVAAMPGSPSVD